MIHQKQNEYAKTLTEHRATYLLCQVITEDTQVQTDKGNKQQQEQKVKFKCLALNEDGKEKLEIGRASCRERVL